MWSNTSSAQNTIYISQATHSNFMLCDHTWLYVGTAQVAALDSSPMTLAVSITVQRVPT
jgi:hypothetical protein